MVMRRFVCCLLLVSLCISSLFAAEGVTLYPVSTREKVVPQTDELDAYGKHVGRSIPVTKSMQPVVDPRLPEFIPAFRSTALQGTVIMKCSDVLAYTCHDYVDQFKKYYPYADIELSEPYVGSAGASELINKTVDLVMVSREPRPNEYPDFKKAFGYDFTAIPVQGGSFDYFGWLDTMCFIVNKNNPIEYITMSQIDAIFSTSLFHAGKAAETWGDLGIQGEWAGKKINRYAITHWNGFEEFIRIRCLDKKDGQAASNLYATQATWRNDMHYEKKVFDQAKLIKQDPYGIAYTGLAYVDEDVKVLPIKLDDGTLVGCTYENVCNGSWPLNRYCYLNYNRAPGGEWNNIIKEFLRFMLSKDAAEICAAQNVYIPLTAPQANAARDTAGLPHEDFILKINGKTVDLSNVPVSYDYAGMKQVYYLPLFETLKACGATCSYDKDRQLYTVTCGNKQSQFRVGSGWMIVDGKENPLTLNSKVWGNCIYMPIDGIDMMCGTKTDVVAWRKLFSMTK